MEIEILEELVGKEIEEVETFSNEEIVLYLTDGSVYRISGRSLEVTKDED